MLEQSRETNLLIPSKRASPQKFEERLNTVGYCHVWAIQVCAAVNGMVFKQSTLGQDIYCKSESLGLEQGIIFQETYQLVEDSSLDWGNPELPLKNIKKSNRRV